MSNDLEVKILVLANGERIISKVDLSLKDRIYVFKPRLVQPYQVAGNISVQLIPFVIGMDDELKHMIYINGIISVIEPDKTLVNDYLNSISIVKAASSNLIQMKS